MKKTLVLVILTIFLISSLSTITLTAQPPTPHTIQQTITLSTPTITTTTDYTQLTLSEATSTLYTSGKPILPKITRTIPLPFGTTIKTLTVDFTDITTHHLTKPIKPATEPQPLTNTKNHEINTYDTTIYHSNQPYPTQQYTYHTGAGLHQNQHVTFLTIQFYPIQYYPQSNTITTAQTINYHITYNQPQPLLSPTESADLAILSPASYTTTLQPLIDHKNAHNIQTIHRTLEDITTQYSGRDQPEQIKYAIKDLIETHDITYVLIIGSIHQFPMRYSAIRVWNEQSMPTDLYFADIYNGQGQFCSWDTNNNNIFGEYDWDNGMIDSVDLYTDVHIGRIPCTTTQELTDMINKIITYETTASQGNWFNNLVLMAGDTFPFHGNIEGEFVTQKIADIRPDFTAKKIWTSQNNYNPISIDWTITQGAGFVSYSGHGYEQGFGTSPPNVEKRIQYWSPYLIGLLNRDKLPIVFFDACSTTKLDFDMEGFEEYYPYFTVIMKAIQGQNYDPTEPFPCFAWQLLKKPRTGAIATIGATRVAFTNVDHGGIHGGAGYLNYHFFQAYTPGITVAEMLTQAQNDYINNVGHDCVTLEEFVLLGDPSLRTGGY